MRRKLAENASILPRRVVKTLLAAALAVSPTICALLPSRCRSRQCPQEGGFWPMHPTYRSLWRALPGPGRQAAHLRWRASARACPYLPRRSRRCSSVSARQRLSACLCSSDSWPGQFPGVVATSPGTACCPSTLPPRATPSPCPSRGSLEASPPCPRASPSRDARTAPFKVAEDRLTCPPARSSRDFPFS